ncbi:cytochrome P450 [Aspergillus parasiticus]|uniref:Cytochrome P450 n=1 Tax=Aspergillus parasiticus TaxID=5067 RepID=A0A5N6DFT9_ASPPA|nr:cytochrome P450 [Aspergillus parasiticus]
MSSFIIDQLMSNDAIYTISFLILASLVTRVIFLRHYRFKLPVVNGRKWNEIGYDQAKKRFLADAEGLMKSVFEKFGDAFYFFTDQRYRMILSPKYANVIRNDERLSLALTHAEEFQAHIRGFEPLLDMGSDSGILMETITSKISPNLDSLVGSLSEEAAVAIQRNWTDKSDWNNVSSRSFLGEELCRNPAWLEVSVAYSNQMFTTARELRGWPKILRPLISIFLPSCRRLRGLLEEARLLLAPFIAKRKSAGAFVQQGSVSEPGKSIDAMDWLDEVARGRPYDPLLAQLGLSFVTIDTTTDFLFNLLCDLSANEELLKALRDEIVGVIGAEPISKPSLQKLKIMDSVMKESQRMRPPLIGKRCALLSCRLLFLPDGLKNPKGTSVAVAAINMMDSTVWPQSETFDGYRFMNMRQNPKEATSALFVTTSPKHLGFGHGKQACPGRFFAAIELKVLLCHILLKYDFQVCATPSQQTQRHGFHILPNPNVEISVKRREAEIQLNTSGL